MNSSIQITDDNLQGDDDDEVQYDQADNLHDKSSPKNDEIPYYREEFPEGPSGLTCCGKLRFFIKQSLKDIKRHKC